MEAAAAVAEVFSTLKSVGLLGAAIVLCFLGLAAWVSREALRTGRPFRIKVSPRSLEIRVDPEQSTHYAQPKKGGAEATSTEPNVRKSRVGRHRKDGGRQRD